MHDLAPYERGCEDQQEGEIACEVLWVGYSTAITSAK
jgi:hypothetical protein